MHAFSSDQLKCTLIKYKCTLQYESRPGSKLWLDYCVLVNPSITKKERTKTPDYFWPNFSVPNFLGGGTPKMVWFFFCLVRPILMCKQNFRPLLAFDRLARVGWVAGSSESKTNSAQFWLNWRLAELGNKFEHRKRHHGILEMTVQKTKRSSIKWKNGGDEKRMAAKDNAKKQQTNKTSWGWAVPSSGLN